jgi:hypothetical protein
MSAEEFVVFTGSVIPNPGEMEEPAGVLRRSCAIAVIILLAAV